MSDLPVLVVLVVAPAALAIGHVGTKLAGVADELADRTAWARSSPAPCSSAPAPPCPA